ncbi:hypothetical protein ACF07U_28375 [Streptomyces californicus]|uniref:hypothetical protein n=1 Tax=Streptomyces TaxID=1883 RepID=UPI00136C0AF1|nr:hypothetical protein [Streptomyces sp. SID8374]MYX17057.1 hypothetical protein [Streptomyces sp. SID8374]
MSETPNFPDLVPDGWAETYGTPVPLPEDFESWTEIPQSWTHPFGRLINSAGEHFAITNADWDRFIRSARVRVGQIGEMREMHSRGIGVAPIWNKPHSEQFAHEAKRRKETGDPTWPLWRAQGLEFDRMETESQV